MSTLSPVKLKQSSVSSPSKVKTAAPINWTPKIPAATDFVGFVNSLDIVAQANREGMRAPDFRPAKNNQKGFFENLTSWVETYKNTEETLDKDKRKLKEMPDEDNDDTMSRLNETQSVAQTNKKSVMGGIKKTTAVLDGLSAADDKYVYSEWEKEVHKFVHKSQTTVAKEFGIDKSPFRLGVENSGPVPKDERLKYLEEMLGHQKCEEKRQQYVKDLAAVQMKVQSFLSNPISNEKLVARVIEETEEDGDEPTKEIQATFLGVSTMPLVNKTRTEVALVDFQKHGEPSLGSPSKIDHKDYPTHQKSTPRSKVASPPKTAVAAADTGRKIETGRTNASTALPATGRSKLLINKVA